MPPVEAPIHIIVESSTVRERGGKGIALDAGEGEEPDEGAEERHERTFAMASTLTLVASEAKKASFELCTLMSGLFTKSTAPA